MSGWPPGGEAYEVEPVAGEMPSSVILPHMTKHQDLGGVAKWAREQVVAKEPAVSPLAEATKLARDPAKGEVFNYYVDVSDGTAPSRHVTAYRGNDAAEAMAAWSKGISDGHEYVTLEALRERRK